MMPEDPRIRREIKTFAAHGRLHSVNPAMQWRNQRVVGPAAREAFGADGVHTFYAERIHEAIQRTGATTVVSIGCGSGHEEIETLRCAEQLGLPPFAIIGLELSPVSAERANRLAHEEGLSNRFHVIVRNLNSGLPELPPAAAVMAHHVLHHVVELETVYASIAQLLHAQGSLLTWDMIGRNGHQRWPEIAPLIRNIWRTVPPAQRYDHMLQRPMLHWQDWDCAIEGFEGVRAQEVLPLLTEHFVACSFLAWGGLTDAFVNDRTGPCFNPESREADLIFLDQLADLEADLLCRRATTPTEMGAEFHRKDSGFVPTPQVTSDLDNALRAPEDAFEIVPLNSFNPNWPIVDPPPDALPAEKLNYAALSEAGAVKDGWETDGWAIMGEQELDLCFAEPVSALRMEVWHNLPAMRPQSISAISEGEIVLPPVCVPPEELSVLNVIHPKGGSARWRLRLACTTYRQPDEDGGPDRRPLAWNLVSIEPQARAAGENPT